MSVLAEKSVHGGYVVRDSKDTSGAHLHYTEEEWSNGRGVQFTTAGFDDVPEHLAAVRAQIRTGTLDGQWFKLTKPDDATVLWFDIAEVAAFGGVWRNWEV